MSHVAVLPFNVRPWLDRCVASMSSRLSSAASLLLVDNTETNAGVAASWNQGVDRLLAGDEDWLLVLSQSMRFGPPEHGDDFLDLVESRKGAALVVEAHHGVGWHCVAFSRQVLTEVGPFDPVFHAYMEDIDWGHRFILTYGQPGEPLWQKVSAGSVAFAGFASGIDVGGARPDHQALEATYAQKWGGHKGLETYSRPYNDQELPLTFTGVYPGETGLTTSGGGGGT